MIVNPALAKDILLWSALAAVVGGLAGAGVAVIGSALSDRLGGA